MSSVAKNSFIVLLSVVFTISLAGCGRVSGQSRVHCITDMVMFHCFA